MNNNDHDSLGPMFQVMLWGVGIVTGIIKLLQAGNSFRKELKSERRKEKEAARHRGAASAETSAPGEAGDWQ